MRPSSARQGTRRGCCRSPEHGRDEGLETGVEPHVRPGDVVHAAVEAPGHGAHGGADQERQRDDRVDVDPR